MRLLVTGGAGFIGANFVLRARATRPDWTITVLDSLTYAANPASLDPVREEVELVVGSITDADLVDRLVGEHDAVLHLAAESHNDLGLEDPGVFVETNVVGTFRVLEAVRRHGVRLHHVSTDEVYGDLGEGSSGSFTEDSPVNPSSPYSATKAGADHLVRAWVRSYGIAATLSNCSNNYGPRQHVEKFIPRQVTAVLSDQRPKLYGSGTQVRDWIHVEDHADALVAILERGELGRTYLVGADGEMANRDVVATILELMGRPADFYDHVPDRPGHDVRYSIDPGRLRRELGWEPRFRDLRAGLADTIEWYRTHEDWWRAARLESEKTYARIGR